MFRITTRLLIFILLSTHIRCISSLIFKVVASNCSQNHCRTCNLTLCLSCSAGYYLYMSFFCNECSTGCDTCTSATICSLCFPKFYLSSNSCYSCLSECATCSSSTNCDSCITGYYLSSSKCSPCPTGCAACSSNTFCSSCNDNYYLSSNQCFNCPTQCSTCTSPSVCNSCIDGYYLQGNACIACLSPCSNCVNSNTECTACEANYGLVGTTCQLCTSPCTSCVNSVTNCTACIDSTTQSTPSCDCTSPAKYQDSNYQCQDCVSPCLNCSSASSCDSCIDTYLLSGTVCIPCTPPCKNCNGSVTTCSTCVDANQSPPLCQCNSGYLIDSATQTCNQCTYPCATCQTSVSHCLTCASTYTYDSSAYTCNCLTTQYEENGSPNQCQNCLPPCLTCSGSSTFCTTCDHNLNRQLDYNQCICQDGYYDNNGTCELCILPCVTCSSAIDCITCNAASQILPACSCLDNNYMDASFLCQNCLSPCLNCIINQSYCTSCISNHYLSGSTCLQCSQPCSECTDTDTKCTLCSDSNQLLAGGTCLCVDGYYMNAIYQCEKCAHPCLTCIGKADKCLICSLSFQLTLMDSCVCPEGYYEELLFNPSKCLKCDGSCKNCVNSATQCTSCLNPNIIVQGNSCECESGYKFNDQYECVFEKCVDPCLTCSIPTFCYSCIEGYLLDNDGICLQCGNDCKICNEQSICQYCNDGYFNQDYLCIKCNDNCLTCMDDSKNCLTCNQNEQLIENKCYCNENTTSNTCLNCQYPCLICEDQCQQCAQINGLNLNDNGECVCLDNYIWQDNQCIEVCPLNCLKCENGICLECQKQYDLLNNECQSSNCGNGQLENQEQCDDGNTNSNDGCYQCNIEINWNCDQEQPSLCTFFESPSLILTYLNQTQSIQYVQLSFSQQISVTSNLSLNMEIIVKGISLENQAIVIYSINEASSNLSYAQYQFGVQILEQLVEKPILAIKLYIDVVNEYDIQLSSYSDEIQLKIPKYLTEEQKQKAESTSNANENVIFGLGAISALSLFMGETAVFQEILRLLQYQSYLKYINIDYPENLEIFFKSTNIVSVSAIIKYTNLSYYLTKYSLKEGTLQTDGKFAYYKYDADLITNLACQIIQLVGFVLIGFVSNTLQRKFYDKKNIIRYLNWIEEFANNHQSSFAKFFLKTLYTIISSVFQAANNFTKQGLRGLFLVNSQDLIFKGFIYLHYMQFNSIRDYIQLVLAVGIIGSYLMFIFVFLSRNSITCGKSNQQIYYDVVTLARQTAFLGLLVYFQDNEILQTILMSFSNVIYFIVLKRRKGMKDLFHKFQQVIELIVILFTISTFFYYQDLQELFSEEFKIQVGWAQIGILILSLAAEGVKFLIAKTKALVKKIQDKLNESKKKTSPMEQFHVVSM